MKVCSCPHWIPPQIANAREGIDRIEGLLNIDLLCTHVATEIGLICRQIEAISESVEDLRRIVEKVVSVASAKMPLASSKGDFDQFASLIIGDYPNSHLAKYFNLKRETFFPTYLDELSSQGHGHLHQHLLDMRALPVHLSRRTAIEKMSFLQVSQVVLETRQVILQKVERSIPDRCNQVLFLVGHSGAGKSTAFCFLTGEKMRLREDFTYVAEGKKEALIGEENATSCTFLPNVEVTKEGAIVDFTGFADSHGPLVDLGIECAFKALVKKYRPQVLVIESIISREGRYEAAAHLGRRLSRVLENKENCLLGMTKYSKDVDFRQMRGARNEPSTEEVELQGEIEALEELGEQDQAEELKQKLSQMQTASPENEEVRKRVEEKENELLKQIGLTNFIRFANLEDPQTLPKIQSVLLEYRQPVNAASNQILDPDHKDLLESRFGDFSSSSKEDQRDFQDPTAFTQSVLSSSLTSTIFSQFPEIGQFLHLPEIDPGLVRGFDKSIASDVLNDYISGVIKAVNKSDIEKILTDPKLNEFSDEIQKIKFRWFRLNNYIRGLLGLEISENRDLVGENYLYELFIRIDQDSRIERKQGLAFVIGGLFLSLPLAIPIIWIGATEIQKGRLSRKQVESGVSQLVEHYSQKLDQMYETIQKLNDLKKLIEKREEIDMKFHTVPISCQSLEALNATVRGKIDSLKIDLKESGWEERIDYLADRFKNCHSKHFLLAWAYGCLMPELSSQSQQISAEALTFGEYWSGRFATADKLAAFEAASESAKAIVAQSSPLLLITQQELYWLKSLAQQLIKDLPAESNQTKEWLKGLLSLTFPLTVEQMMRVREFIWTLVEAKKRALKVTDRNFFIFSMEDIEVCALGTLPEIKMEENPPLNFRVFLAAAAIKALDKLEI